MQIVSLFLRNRPFRPGPVIMFLRFRFKKNGSLNGLMQSHSKPLTSINNPECSKCIIIIHSHTHTQSAQHSVLQLPKGQISHPQQKAAHGHFRLHKNKCKSLQGKWPPSFILAPSRSSTKQQRETLRVRACIRRNPEWDIIIMFQRLELEVVCKCTSSPQTKNAYYKE